MKIAITTKANPPKTVKSVFVVNEYSVSATTIPAVIKEAINTTSGEFTLAQTNATE